MLISVGLSSRETNKPSREPLMSSRAPIDPEYGDGMLICTPGYLFLVPSTLVLGLLIKAGDNGPVGRLALVTYISINEEAIRFDKAARTSEAAKV